MPNAKVLSEKQAIVAELTEKLQTAASGVLVDYKGITVAEDTALRAECRKNELDYAVVKNTLVRFAINNVGLNEMDDVLNGTTSLALSHGDPIAPMRVINKFSKQFNGEKFTIKAGFMDGKVLSMDEIKALAARLEGAGFPLPRRPFRPHVTLARRVAFPGPAPRGQDLLPRPLSVPCGRVSLLRSQLRPQGPLYTELAARG